MTIAAVLLKYLSQLFGLGTFSCSGLKVSQTSVTLQKKE